MEILLTGPFGTIGARVLVQLEERGHAVTCLDLDTPANRARAARLPPSVRVIWGDVTREADVRGAVRGKQAVVHLAAIIPPFSDAKPELAERVNVGGTRHVIEAIAAEAPDAVLVFPSSISVHGFSAGREPPCRIDAPYDGRDGYASHKIACERMLRASAIRWVILRLGACVGADDVDKGGDAGEAMARTFAIAADTRIEYLHPDDAAIAIANACTCEAAVGKALFLGSGRESRMTWRAFVSTIPRSLGLGDFPAEVFGAAPYYTDWMDTDESERLLQFQRYGYPAYVDALARRGRWKRWLLTPMRPLARRLMLAQVAKSQKRRA